MEGRTSKKSAKDAKTDGAKPVLLSGGNPQIPKGDGDAPVQAYIAAMPGWKSDVGRRLDDLIVGAVPDVRKAVRWNSPFYGIEGQGWFLSYHVFTRYVKVTFFQGIYELRHKPRWMIGRQQILKCGRQQPHLPSIHISKRHLIRSCPGVALQSTPGHSRRLLRQAQLRTFRWEVLL